jgi:hypothetical protein
VDDLRIMKKAPLPPRGQEARHSFPRNFRRAVLDLLRGNYLKPVYPVSIRDYVITDFERVMHKSREGRLWLIFTGRDDGWPNLEREEPQMIAAYLNRIGCRKEGEQRFAKEVVNQFVCQPTK